MAAGTAEDMPAEGYDGPAVVSTGGTTLGAGGDSSGGGGEDVEVQVRLRGHFEPLDGQFHWYGRVEAHEGMARRQPGETVVLTTSHGSAAGRLSDLDPWDRFRISGTGRPPF